MRDAGHQAAQPGHPFALDQARLHRLQFLYQAVQLVVFLFELDVAKAVDFRFLAIVFGLEAEVSFGKVGGAGTGLDIDMNTFGTARARFGYAADRALWYLTGGLAWGNNEFNITGAGFGVAPTRDPGEWQEKHARGVPLNTAST